ncbi:MAG: phosphoribosylformylglycinamidine synthase [Bacteroidota bacterium]|nr:phosphoribosylformylglycinamidine synthase [Bacteroidota bacterium]
MILFFEGTEKQIFAVKAKQALLNEDISKLEWLFSGGSLVNGETVEGFFIGPRVEMITPWSTNAVEITQNMGIPGIERIEEFVRVDSKSAPFDRMLKAFYENLSQEVFTISKQPEPIKYIDDIEAYNQKEGLALNPDEVAYLKSLNHKLGRQLTDSEIFGFSQVNSEHCRHKIFNGTFIIDGEEKPLSLFQLIKHTTKTHPNRVVSAYSDNCAFLQGPVVGMFAPKTQDKPDFFEVKDVETVISIKAETHNFPTTVEPFNGAATGTGGEIRDRIGGGKGSFPLTGTAVYMTSYPRLDGGRPWEKKFPARKWLYQTPEQILIKASNGASDFGNKFGQPLICGSLFTFEHEEKGKKFGFDKVIMMAGGVGWGVKRDSLKSVPVKGDKVVLLGGDNYRIGMGGGAVSSVNTGEFANSIELNAVQRSNPEMQKRVNNAIRALCESDINPVISIHDHGAGGHLNCLSELVDGPGGVIYMDELPIGDPTLSAKEIVGNESQERMGLVLKDKDIDMLKRISDRERAPMYVVGEVTGDEKFTVYDRKTETKPIDLKLEDMFGNPPKTIMRDETTETKFAELSYQKENLKEYLDQVLQIEGVACKDWLTNKVDRSVTGRIALQQTAGEVQLPLNDMAIVALDYQGPQGIASSVGHAPAAAMIDPAAGSILAIAESLTNIVWAPLQDGLKGVSLSANWMWPCKNPGEDSRLYRAVKAASDFSVALGINIPTGKDSLSMTQKYPDGDVVYSPGTVIISAGAEVTDIRKAISPVVQDVEGSSLLYIDLSKSPYYLGGSSFAQVINFLGNNTPTVADTEYFVAGFGAIQQLIEEGKVISGHDISAGGMITTLLEMTFASASLGLNVDLTDIPEDDVIKLLFSENPGVIVQVKDTLGVQAFLEEKKIDSYWIGDVVKERSVVVRKNDEIWQFDIDALRDTWFKTSYLLDRKQSGEKLALERFNNYKVQPLQYTIKPGFKGTFESFGIDAKRRESTGIKAAIIREKGINGDREMAYAMYLAGMDVKDVHVTDLVSGRETLEDVQMIVFTGGFSNSDVLGSAKGWAGALLYNPTAKAALDNFYKRSDTLSLGVCNGCQLMVELGLVTPDHEQKPKMRHNNSHKFESIFLNVSIPENKSVMLKSLSGSRLGIWVAHGEGKFDLPYEENRYNVAMKYSYEGYPGNPNGSAYNVAGLCSEDGRHLVMMPHLERAIFPWNWAYYPSDRKNDKVTPWIEAFVNAREWLKAHKK